MKVSLFVAVRILRSKSDFDVSIEIIFLFELDKFGVRRIIRNFEIKYFDDLNSDIVRN